MGEIRLIQGQNTETLRKTMLTGYYLRAGQGSTVLSPENYWILGGFILLACMQLSEQWLSLGTSWLVWVLACFVWFLGTV